jgi:hypothetical protein
MARFLSRNPIFKRTESPLAVILLAVIATVLILAINWNSLLTLSWEGLSYYALAQKGPQHIENPMPVGSSIRFSPAGSPISRTWIFTNHFFS